MDSRCLLLRRLPRRQVPPTTIVGMLCGQFVGMEATVNFQQIYTVPALQNLGMPLSLTYILGLVSGPCSIFLLPPLGWLIDREDNSQRRKFASIVFSAAALQIAGMLCVLSGNALHLRHLLDYNATTHAGCVSYGTLNTCGSPDVDLNVSVSESGGNISWFNPNETIDFFAESDGMKRATCNSSEVNNGSSAFTYTGSGRNPVSLALSLVAASLPLGYCLLFSWVGAVEELTGDASAPMWIGTANGIISVITFVFVGKV